MMRSVSSWSRGLGGAMLACALLWACGDPNNATTIEGGDAGAAGRPADDSGVGGEGPGNGAEPEAPSRFGLHEAYEPAAVAVAEPLGGAGGGNLAALMAPFGTHTGCDDAILGEAEECDDGDEGSDSCTEECQTRDVPAIVAAVEGRSRFLGVGRHPMAGLEAGFIAAYVDVSDAEPVLGATLFDIWGRPTHALTLSTDAISELTSNPVAAALPEGRYVVAWSDLDVDGSDLGIALRRVDADGSLHSIGIANARREFSQLNPDMLWTDSQLVVAWEDYADATSGPDLRYRAFNADLGAVSGDQVLAESALPEAGVALASFQGSWAAAYREGLRAVPRT